MIRPFCLPGPDLHGFPKVLQGPMADIKMRRFLTFRAAQSSNNHPQDIVQARHTDALWPIRSTTFGGKTCRFATPSWLPQSLPLCWPAATSNATKPLPLLLPRRPRQLRRQPHRRLMRPAPPRPRPHRRRPHRLTRRPPPRPPRLHRPPVTPAPRRNKGALTRAQQCSVAALRPRRPTPRQERPEPPGHPAVGTALHAPRQRSVAAFSLGLCLSRQRQGLARRGG